MKKVKVYSFQGYKVTTDETTIPRRMATMDFIKRNGLTPLWDTAKEVNASEVDENGRYPIQTE